LDVDAVSEKTITSDTVLKSIENALDRRLHGLSPWKAGV